MLSYFFNIAPGREFNYYIPIIILASLLIIGSIAFSFIYKTKRKTDFAFKRNFKNVSKVMTIMGLLLFITNAVRYENIPYFSMRIWLYLIILLILYFTYRYLRIYQKRYLREKDTTDHKPVYEKPEENKYLPNKNRKKKS